MRRGDSRGELKTISKALICPHDPFSEDCIKARRKKMSDGSESDDLQLNPDDFFRWKEYFSNPIFLKRKTILAGHY